MDSAGDSGAGRDARPAAYQSIIVPLNTLLLVGIGIGEALNLARLASEETV